MSQGQAQPNPYQGQPGAPAGEDPGKTLGIVGLVLAIVGSVIGLIISIVAFRSSKRAGFKNTPALAGIIVGAITTVITIAVIAVSIIGVMAIKNRCDDLGPGTHQVGSTTINCG